MIYQNNNIIPNNEQQKNYCPTVPFTNDEDNKNISPLNYNNIQQNQGLIPLEINNNKGSNQNNNNAPNRNICHYFIGFCIYFVGFSFECLVLGFFIYVFTHLNQTSP